MDKSDELIKAQAIEIFPGLLNDPSFKITSEIDFRYNCIAWAYGLYNDRWMQFNTNIIPLDGICYWWPKGVTVSQNIQAYIEAFQTKGFELCDSHEFENGFIKIALYINQEENCTHAARQKRDGIWMSKLGPWHDIEHSSPYSIEGDNYGSIFCFMKMKW